MFFEGPEGYKFDARKRLEAKHWCIEETKKALHLGRGVVISNVFCQIKEMERFFLLAPECLIIECNVLKDAKKEDAAMPILTTSPQLELLCA